MEGGGEWKGWLRGVGLEGLEEGKGNGDLPLLADSKPCKEVEIGGLFPQDNPILTLANKTPPRHFSLIIDQSKGSLEVQKIKNFFLF